MLPETCPRYFDIIDQRGMEFQSTNSNGLSFHSPQRKNFSTFQKKCKGTNERIPGFETTGEFEERFLGR